MQVGQETFRHLKLTWHLSDDYGLTVTKIRCAVCGLPLQPIARRVNESIFLTCTHGHLVGTQQMPNAQTKSVIVDNVHTYNRHLYEVVQAFKQYFESK